MKFFTVIFFLFSGFLFAQEQQDFSDSWSDLYSYYQVKDITAGNNKIYAAAQNAVIAYNLSSGEIEKISSVKGLSGEKISTIHYAENLPYIVLGYENGLIETFNTQTGKVYSFIDILEKQTIAPDNKRINQFKEGQNKIYIATNYGISVLNLANLEFGDTFYIGNNGSQLAVAGIEIFQNKIYAATQGGGLRYANIDNPNLIDYQVWQSIGSNYLKEITRLQDKLYVLTLDNRQFQIVNNAFVFANQYNSDVRDFRSFDDKLVVSLQNEVLVLDASMSQLASFGGTQDFTANFNTALLAGERIFIGDQNEGLLKANTAVAGNYEYLSPPGPLMNRIFAMEAIPNELWLTFGEYSLYLNPFPLNKRGLSHLKNEQWINFRYQDLPQARSIVDVTINPNRTEQVFFSSYFDGLLEIVNDEQVFLYDENNSNLEPIDNAEASPDDLRIGSSVFDNAGNLWFTEALYTKGLLKKAPESTNFEMFDVSEVIQDPPNRNAGFPDIISDNRNNLFLGSYLDGIIGFNIQTESFAKVSGDEGAGNLPSNQVNTLALDNNNQLWIGTNRGIRVLYNPAAMFEEPNLQTDQIIILDDDGVAQELLANTNIAVIRVDGNNNKWVGTEAGAFYLSANGQETIYRFTKENSPLPSNIITDIAIDQASGEVYIGTINGLLKFRGKATASAEDFSKVRAYPNPVRPQYHGAVTIDGLQTGANIKITDIEGNLVYETTAQGGSIQWDTRAFGKHKVASGVYMVLITSQDQTETKITKIMIVR
ncbi:type IX secretion system anionic LPS delivery protein PorZ [Haloflavibacter putidus]|uniref:T9SS type A sorting domain-containing protein n=1 Tax=Haloflavibacter putidus TaxID=2576776 RepID=A0A507ZRU7_9FLAO|nr:two-component regulator propeller domain-containing protein [Haloflavibacter putidus]TQD40526.1 T9SS type A sorting domain-containing protein [Haloflavibacter putidus]